MLYGAKNNREVIEINKYGTEKYTESTGSFMVLHGWCKGSKVEI